MRSVWPLSRRYPFDARLRMRRAFPAPMRRVRFLCAYRAPMSQPEQYPTKQREQNGGRCWIPPRPPVYPLVQLTQRPPRLPVERPQSSIVQYRHCLLLQFDRAVPPAGIRCLPAPQPPLMRGRHQGRAAGLEQADKRRMTVDFNLEGAEVHVVSPAPTDSGQALSAISSDGVVRRAISSCASISETSRKSFLNHARMNAPNSASEPNHVLRIATPRPTFEAQDS